MNPDMQAVYDCIKANGPMTIPEVSRKLFPNAPAWEKSTKLTQTYSKVHKLLDEGKIRIAGKKGQSDVFEVV